MLRLTAAGLLLDTITASLALPEPDPGLAQSMRIYGLFQPIDVRLGPDGRHLLVNGRRRLAVARRLGWTHVAALVEPAEDATLPADLKAILINTQRKRMAQLHVARRVRRLVREQDHSQAEIARALHRGQLAVSEMLHVLDCRELERAVDRDGLEWGAARTLSRLTSTPREALLEELYLERARAGRFPSVREVEERVRRRQGKPPLLTVAPGDLPPLIDELLARDAAIGVQTVRGKQTQLTLTLTVAEADQEWLQTISPHT